MPDYVTISRDPFGRFDTIRQTILKDERKSCAWCGRPGRFRYGSLNDGLTTQPHFDQETFCSIGCRRAYHT
ncbi:uncharacterized protein Dvar_40920 [Desulfosarcina variabilis str. Montpellier]|uniref:hypothetical protein n=1 Tax=Desulfosarcina variabilis TaxID=2300 RepID=UPI003AFA9A0F